MNVIHNPGRLKDDPHSRVSYVPFHQQDLISEPAFALKHQYPYYMWQPVQWCNSIGNHGWRSQSLMRGQGEAWQHYIGKYRTEKIMLWVIISLSNTSKNYCKLKVWCAPTSWESRLSKWIFCPWGASSWTKINPRQSCLHRWEGLPWFQAAYDKESLPPPRNYAVINTGCFKKTKHSVQRTKEKVFLVRPERSSMTYILTTGKGAGVYIPFE